MHSTDPVRTIVSECSAVLTYFWAAQAGTAPPQTGATQIWISCHILRPLCFITWDDCVAVNETATPTPFHDKTCTGLLNRSKGLGTLIRRSNPRGRRGGNGNVHSLRVWSHMREIRESCQQVRFSHRLAFNFAELGCRSSQVGVLVYAQAGMTSVLVLAGRSTCSEKAEWFYFLVQFLACRPPHKQRCQVCLQGFSAKMTAGKKMLTINGNNEIK